MIIQVLINDSFLLPKLPNPRFYFLCWRQINLRISGSMASLYGGRGMGKHRMSSFNIFGVLSVFKTLFVQWKTPSHWTILPMGHQIYCPQFCFVLDSTEQTFRELFLPLLANMEHRTILNRMTNHQTGCPDQIRTGATCVGFAKHF